MGLKLILILFMGLYLLDRYQNIFNNVIDIIYFWADKIFPYKIGSTVKSTDDHDGNEPVFEIIKKDFFSYYIKRIDTTKSVVSSNHGLRYYPSTINRKQAKQYYEQTNVSKFNQDLKDLIQ